MRKVKVKDLHTDLKKLSLEIRAEDKTEAREVVASTDDKFHKVCEALVGDETGSIYLSLWDEQADEIQKGKHYRITNAYTSMYRNSLRLNIGKYGKIEEIEADFEINTANNLSLKEL